MDDVGPGEPLPEARGERPMRAFRRGRPRARASRVTSGRARKYWDRLRGRGASVGATRTTATAHRAQPPFRQHVGRQAGRTCMRQSDKQGTDRPSAEESSVRECLWDMAVAWGLRLCVGVI